MTQKALYVVIAAGYVCVMAHEICLSDSPTEPYDLIINITNDGWFGKSIGPKQHLTQARIKAISEDRPLIRSACNGISCIIDRYGTVHHPLQTDAIGTINEIIHIP